MEFLRYPQLIRAFFNRHLFGPPPDFTQASTWPWVGHFGFGSNACNYRPIQTRFRFGYRPSVLNLAAYNNSPDRSTKSTPSGFNALRLLVNTGFQVLFHSPPGVLFTFPSRYFPLSVTEEYLAFGGGPPSFTQDSTCPVLLWISAHLQNLRVRDFYPLRYGFPSVFRSLHSMLVPVRTPGLLLARVWALPLSLATTYGITFVFFS